MLYWELCRLDKDASHEAEHKAGRELCARLLKKHFGIDTPEIAVGEFGKPYLVGGGAHFNISHSHALVACAVSDVEIGIDIEAIKSDDEERLGHLARRYFTDGEISYIESAQDRTRAFYYIWTRKEAVSKCTGKPFLALKDYDTSIPSEHIASYEYEDYIVSIATNI